MTLTEDHLQYCNTDRQREVVAAIIKEGGQRAAARALGLAKSTVDQHAKLVRQTATAKGLTESSDMRVAVPQETHLLGKITTELTKGEITKQWVRASPDKDAMIALAEHLAQAALRRTAPFEPIPAPEASADDQMVAYIIADLHLGMYAWKPEAGDEYNCQVAREILLEAIARLAARTPETKTAVIAQLGDYIHITDETNATPRGKNQLDVDGRWKQVVDLGMDLYHAAIDLALQKHEQVTVYNVRGNHDMYTAHMVGKLLESEYSRNDRVKIVCDPCDYYYHRFGVNLIQMSHGHLAKPQELGGIMMSDMRPVVGECEFNYSWTGHIHHETSKSFGWFTHESFATLAAKDAHAAGRYRSARSMDAIVLDRKYGIGDRSRVSIKEIMEAIA